MENNITKPMTVAKQEFINNITENINNCGLPMFVIEFILKDLLNAVSALANSQYENDMKQYVMQLQQREQQEQQQELNDSNVG